MSWLRNITTQQIVPVVRRHDDSSRVTAALSYREANDVQSQHNGYTYEYAHRTELRVGTIWYANQAQFEGRQQLAERAIIETVFEPYTKYRSRLLHAVMDRDTDEAIRIIGLIEKEIGIGS